MLWVVSISVVLAACVNEASFTCFFTTLACRKENSFYDEVANLVNQAFGNGQSDVSEDGWGVEEGGGRREGERKRRSRKVRELSFQMFSLFSPLRVRPHPRVRCTGA